MANLFDQFDASTPSRPEEIPAPKANLFDQFDAVKPVEPATLGERAKDIGVSALKGVVAFPQSIVGLADIPTGGRVGKALQEAGVNFPETQKILEEQYSPEQKKAFESVQKAEGFVPTLKALAEHPSVALHTAIESAPSMLGGAGIAKGAMKAAPKLSPLAAGAVGEGAITAGQTEEQIREQSPTGLTTPEQSALAATSGALTGAITGGAGVAARKLNVGDINTFFLGNRGQVLHPDTPPPPKGLIRRVLEETGIEATQEGLQSAQEQATTNIAVGKPWDEGIGSSAALGAVVGAGMAGPVAAITPPPSVPLREAPAKEEQPDLGGISVETPERRIAAAVDKVTMEGKSALGTGPLSKAAHAAYDTGITQPQKEAADIASQQIAEEDVPQFATPLTEDKVTSAQRVINSVQAALDKDGTLLRPPPKLSQAAKDLGVYNSAHKPKEMLDAVTAKLNALAAPTPEEPRPPSVVTPEMLRDARLAEQEHPEQETDYALNIPTTGQDDGRRGARPEGGEEVRYPAEGGERVLRGRPEERYIQPEPSEAPTPQEGIISDESKNAAAQEAAAETPKEEIERPINRMPEKITLGRGVIKTNPIANRPLYHETNVEGIDDIIRSVFSNSEDKGMKVSQFVTDNPDIAIGQGKNKGVHVEYDGDYVSGLEHKKPGLVAGITGAEYITNYINREALKKVILPAGVSLKGAAKVLANKFMDKSILPDGRTQYVKKGAVKVTGVPAETPKEEVEKPIDEAIAKEHPLHPANEYQEAEKPEDNKKAVANFQDLPIAIENPKGSIRKGKGWQTEMKDHYGEILSATGADEDAIDTFIPEGLSREQIDSTKTAYVVDQIDPKTGTFDEHKVMLGYPSREAAEAAYRRNYSPDWKGLGAITEMPVEDFKKWVREGDTKAPLSSRIRAKGAEPPLETARKTLLQHLPSGDLTGLTGPKNAEVRATLLAQLRGVKAVPKTKATNAALRDEFYRQAGVEPDTAAGMAARFSEWAKGEPRFSRPVEQFRRKTETLLGLFGDLDARSPKVVRDAAKERIRDHPLAERIQYVEANFLDLLVELEQKHRVQIKC